MAHVRETITQAIYSSLVSNVPSAVASGRILRSRSMPSGAGTALLVYHDHDHYKQDDISSLLTDSLYLTIVEIADSMSETTLNGIDLAVSDSLQSDITVGGYAISVHQVKNEVLFIEAAQTLTRVCKDGANTVSFANLGNDSLALFKKVRVKFRTQATDASTVG